MLGKQEQLRDKLDGLAANAAPQITEEEFERRLLEKGIISKIPSRIAGAVAYRNRKPVEVEGKPISEIIIEERR